MGGFGYFFFIRGYNYTNRPSKKLIKQPPLTIITLMGVIFMLLYLITTQFRRVDDFPFISSEPLS